MRKVSEASVGKVDKRHPVINVRNYLTHGVTPPFGKYLEGGHLPFIYFSNNIFYMDQ